MRILSISTIVSAVFWGALAVVFGVGAAIAGLSALPSAGGVLALLVGLGVIALAYAMHRVSCIGLGYLFRPRR